MRLANYTKVAGRGKMVCGVDSLVSEESNTMINQCVMDCVFLASAEWSAKINTADLRADMLCQFCDGHVCHRQSPSVVRVAFSTGKIFDASHFDGC